MVELKLLVSAQAATIAELTARNAEQAERIAELERQVASALAQLLQAAVHLTGSARSPRRNLRGIVRAANRAGPRAIRAAGWSRSPIPT
ncbi:hypothetical protein OG883_29805 [Streptomyces sp. NBC_01142]|uniref:hypothetical protein n=1 Tax=Streptomyces sp. NBC_01142 TaxID=2975865 RepID=UPI002255CA62|nr:hypothetical protein [Streptomyces sp. NBC_01142]MCX4823998.1 hypothetical protein [Streptomyces sp. NBC_01142]